METGKSWKKLALTGVVPVAHGGTGSATRNFVDLSTRQKIGGHKTFSNPITGSITGNAGGFSGSLAGDVNGSQGSTIVGALQGVPISANPPSAGDVLGFDGASWSGTSLPLAGYGDQTSDTHLMDTFTPVSNIELPVGTYVINANAWLENTSPSNSSSLGVCELVFGPATDEVEAGLLGPSNAPLNEQTLAMTVAAHVVTDLTSATLSCEAVGNTGETSAKSASMTATEIGSLNP